MRQYFPQLLVIIFSTALVACVQVTPVPKTNKSQLATSSVRDAAINYAQGDTFALAPQYLDEISFDIKQQENIYSLYGNAIIESLNAKGFVKATSAPNFIVGYGVALSADLSDQTINALFGVTPGLQNNEKSIAKGSFLIYIKDAQSGQRVWRATVQGFVQDELTQEQRQIKAATVVNAALSQFYKEK